MIPILANLLVVLGIFVLVNSLITIHKLVKQLPNGSIRTKWIFQTGLVLVFIIGYVGYAIVFWNLAISVSDLIVPGIFLLGSAFVCRTTALALQTALDIRRITLLEKENITDPLMGIYNRRCLDRRLADEFERAKRYQLPLSIMLIDIDYFKKINDTYGHQTGDLVLRYWSELILNVVRGSDIVARYGGEEVLVITPNTTVTLATTLAERIRKNIEAHELVLRSENNDRKEIRITVSIGVAGISPQIDSTERFLTAVDQALYAAKNGGRNRVAKSTDLLSVIESF